MNRGGAAVVLLTVCSLAGCSAAPPIKATATATGSSAAPVTVLGDTVGGLRANFGRPALQRIDGPAQVWLYRSAVCRLNLMLYPGPGGAPQVQAAIPLPRGVSQSACFSSLKRARSGT